MYKDAIIVEVIKHMSGKHTQKEHAGKTSLTVSTSDREFAKHVSSLLGIEVDDAVLRKMVAIVPILVAHRRFARGELTADEKNKVVASVRRDVLRALDRLQGEEY